MIGQGMSAPRSLRSRVGLEVANLKEATQVIVENHYLHRGRTMAQLPYWVLFDGERAGVLLYALPRLSVPYQGHGPMNLIELARMWLDPRVQGGRVRDRTGKHHSPGVATCALGASLRRVRQDWHGKYPHLPLIRACVSWADDEHHEGVVYRAANFEEVGKSGGQMHGTARRRDGGRDQPNEDYRHIKTAFIYRWSKELSESQRVKAWMDWKGGRPKLSKKRIAQLKADGIPLVPEAVSRRYGGENGLRG